MNNLEVFNQPMMTSVMLAELVEKEHKNVLVDVRKLVEFYTQTYSAEKSADLIKSSTYVDSLGRTYPCFELSKDACLDLVTGYSLPHRHAVNQRWQELEQAASADQSKLPQTYIEALEALLAAEKEKLALQEANAEMKPKVEYFDHLVARNLLLGVRDTAKELGVKQNQFVTFLLEGKYVYRNEKGKLRPYAQHTPSLFELKEFTRGDYADAQMLITPQGRETFRLLLQVPRLEKK
uniref:KilAC domain protein n=1 Tax=Podoviridae sp. ctnCN2 TaxID=2825274 RepID=A0A8S5PKV8_9CAUD|nr:MAG TPA: KilAC domain protein [Podoviridae sp. ctnCN2]